MTRTFQITTAVFLSAIALMPRSVDAKCAMQHQQPKVLTQAVAAPVDGGGIVVGTQSVPYDLPERGEALQPTWGFLTGRDLMQPVITVLAPGLVVYRVQPNTRTTGELTDGTAVIAKLTFTKDKVARLPAPRVKAIRQSTADDRRWSPTTSVTLDGTVPADAVAIVLFDAKRKARSWREVTAGASEVEAFARGRCEVVPNGTVESRVGDKVSVAWVDRYGRLSAASKLVTIQGSP